MAALIAKVRPDNFAEEVIREKRRVLLIVLRPDDAFFGQIALAEDVAQKYRTRLKVGLLAEEAVKSFAERFDIRGTPTFLLLAAGKELGRLYGVCDRAAMEEFIERHLDSSR